MKLNAPSRRGRSRAPSARARTRSAWPRVFLDGKVGDAEKERDRDRAEDNGGQRRAWVPACGFRKALTPFAIASTPVKRRRSGRECRSKHEQRHAAGAGGDRSRGRRPAADRRGCVLTTAEHRTSANIAATNPYVGNANASPDWRTPRRLTTVEKRHEAQPRGRPCAFERRHGGRQGEHARGDRNGDGEDVVDQERRSRHEARQTPEVVLGDDVRAPARLVGGTVCV